MKNLEYMCIKPNQDLGTKIGDMIEVFVGELNEVFYKVKGAKKIMEKIDSDILDEYFISLENQSSELGDLNGYYFEANEHNLFRLKELGYSERWTFYYGNLELYDYFLIDNCEIYHTSFLPIDFKKGD